jgi:hypothetical protein
MTNLKVVFALLLGFVLGAWLFHTPTSKAAGGAVRVTSVLMTNGSMQVPVAPGANIIGFACDAPAAAGSDNCYVLTK